MAMQVTRETDGGTVVVGVSGSVDIYSSPELRGELRVALKAKPDRVVVDLKDVSFVDSSGLATLIEALQGVNAYSGKLFLCNLNKAVQGVFELANLDTIFQIKETREAALDA